MGSEDAVPLVETVNRAVEASVERDCPGKKKQGRVPKRIHKAEREKQKRERFNDLFLELSNALELSQQNNGKAFVLSEATRFLKDFLAQIDCLRKENASLLSESQYVSTEKNELKEENSTLENQIEKLQGELVARTVQSKPDLIVPPRSVYKQPEFASHFVGDSLTMPALEPTLPQVPAVFVVPLSHDLQAYQLPSATQLTSNPTSQVSKPHARYPTSVDSWPSQLLGEQPKAGKEFPNSESNSSVIGEMERCPDNL